MNRNLALEFVRATEMAALASARWMGKGDERAADQAAVDAMRSMLDSIECRAEIVIGEGERDEAPMLYIGEKVGTGSGPELELAVDPLEGTTICAKGGMNAISVMAIASKGNLLNAPDTYMDKLAVGPSGKGRVDINLAPAENLEILASAKKCRIQDLTAMILDRPRHLELIEDVRRTGARIHLIGDGDVSAAIATSLEGSGIDILFGIGGAPEGVISAAALRCMGGDFQGKLMFRNEQEKERARKMGIEDISKTFKIDDLASGPVLFCATGITDGSLLDGVRFRSGGATTHSLVMRSESGTIRHIRAEHAFDKKPQY